MEITEKRKESGSRMQENTKQMTLDAMFIALTFVFTAFVNVQLPVFGGAGGLIHLGNVPLFAGAMIYGKRTGALAGGLGMGLFDLLSGWTLWMPCTILTCGLMGYAVGSICKKWNGFLAKIVAVFVALGIKIAGYYIYEAMIIGNGLVAAVKSIPGNVIQVLAAAVLVLVIIKPLTVGLSHIEK